MNYSTAKKLIDAEPDQCRWPVGKTGNSYLFCCCKVDDDYPYCSTHRKMAYASAKKFVEQTNKKDKPHKPWSAK